MKTKKLDVRKLAGTAMLAAVAAVLMFFEFSVPLIPAFIKMDFSELPALIAAFAYGPVSGVAVCLVKNLLHLFFTATGGVGELSNFILGAMFVLPAGLIYKYKKTKGFAVAGAFLGAVVMAGVSVITNYYIVYPIYFNMMPLEAILDAYRAINPAVKNLWQALLWFNLPFTFIKASFSIIITIFIYKPLAGILKGKKTA